MKIPVPPEFTFNGRMTFYECYKCHRFRTKTSDNDETNKTDEDNKKEVEESEVLQVANPNGVEKPLRVLKAELIPTKKSSPSMALALHLNLKNQFLSSLPIPTN